jgi:hypothetical protein
MYVQPCHWSPCHLSPYLHASPKRVCVDVLTRGLMHPSSVLTPGSWEASISVPTLRGIDRLSEQNDRGLSPVDMPWTWTHNMAPEGWHNVRAESRHVIYSSCRSDVPASLSRDLSHITPHDAREQTTERHVIRVLATLHLHACPGSAHTLAGIRVDWETDLIGIANQNGESGVLLLQ